MSNKRVQIWENVKTVIKFWLAGFAIKYCGIEVIFWSAPQRWEEYMREGEPFMSADNAEVGGDT